MLSSQMFKGASGLAAVALWIALFGAALLIDSKPYRNRLSATPSVSGYVRFAGTTSLLAFGVGYDPTKFQDLINLVPRLGAKRS